MPFVRFVNCGEKELKLFYTTHHDSHPTYEKKQKREKKQGGGTFTIVSCYFPGRKNGWQIEKKISEACN